MKLSGIMIGTEDSKVLSDFYTKIFGEAGWHQDDWYGFDMGGANLLIGPHSEVKGRSQTPGRLMITLESNDLQKDFARIKELGTEVIAEPYQPNKEGKRDTWLATFADPDGNYFQLATPWKN